MRDIDVLVNDRNIIGESPIYDNKNKVIYWVDIVKKKFYKYDLATKKVNTYDVGKYDSYLVLDKKGNLLLGMQDGLYRYNFKKDKPQLLGTPPRSYNGYSHRFNDGKCDASGRLWAGTTTFYEESDTCGLYKIGSDYKFKPMISNVRVSNGMGWSPDNTKMYYIDYGKRLVYQFDFNLEKGTLSNRKIFIDFKNEFGNPDGMNVDSKGNLWIAHWLGSRISVWDNQGKKIDQFMFPNKIVTDPLFIGEDLIVSTATIGYSDKQYKFEQPYAGSLLKIHAGITGTPTYRFKTS